MASRRVRPARAAGRAAAISWAGAKAWRLRLAGVDFVDAFKTLVEREAEGRRPFLWLPVAMGLGALLYFAAEREPAALAPFAAILGCGTAALAARRRHRLLYAFFVAATALFVGFGAGVLRTWSTAHAVLDRPKITTATGLVLAVDPRLSGARLLVRLHGLEGVSAQTMPMLVRATTPKSTKIVAGDSVAFKARLLPLPEASRPGGYDFARDAYFQGLGAVGSILGPIELAPGPPQSLNQRFWAALDRARNDMTLRIADVIGGQAGAVAAALVTGKRGLVSEETNAVLRAAGIYHVISISGLHMVLAAGIVFWLFRAGLALVPGLALVAPIKKIAALAAIGAALVYGIFAGAEVATTRSMLMTIVVFGGVLADRPALSMRSLALAAMLLIAAEPECVLGPSFQMSFFAVAALIALHERTGAGAPEAAAAGLRSWIGDPPAGSILEPIPWLIRMALLAALAPLLTTLAAEIATAPFSLYHFQQIASFGILGNAVTLPVVSFIVMPAALLGALAMPFGLDAPVWRAMGVGVDLMLAAAGLVARLPGALATMPAPPLSALLVFCLGLLWLCLWRTRLRLAGLPLLLVGAALASRARPPDLVVARDGSAAMARGEGGRLALIGKSPGQFVLRQWLSAAGDVRAPHDPSLRAGASCDKLGCVSRLVDGRAVALVIDPEAFEEDCRRAAVLVTQWTAPAWCKPALLIDKSVLDVQGATAIRLAGDSFVTETSRLPRAQRPWMSVPQTKSETPGRETANPNKAKPAKSAPNESSDPVKSESAPGREPDEERDAASESPSAADFQ